MLLDSKDTRTCLKSLLTCQNLLPYLAKETQFYNFLGNFLLLSCLKVLQQGSQQSNHNVAIQLIVEVYTTIRPKADIPYQTLASLPGINIPSLQVFDSQMLQLPSLKERIQTAKGFLKDAMGVELSERFKESTSFVLNVNEKQLFMSTKSESKTVLDENETGIENLFAE